MRWRFALALLVVTVVAGLLVPEIGRRRRISPEGLGRA